MTAYRGEIWLANLNPMKKSNEVGKIRPVLIIQNDYLNKNTLYPNTIIIPLSTYLIDNSEPLRIRITKRDKLEFDSDLLVAQIRSIDNSRLIEKLAYLTEKELRKVIKFLNEIIT